MNKFSRDNLPLWTYTKEYLKDNFIPFHTPGHKGWIGISEILSASFDIPDDVCGFPSYKEKSEKLSSLIYGVKDTYYIVNGSTSAVQSSLFSVLKPEDKVLMGRNIHISALSALIKIGAIPLFIPIKYTSEGFPLNVSIEEVNKAIKEKDIDCVFITSPSYYGVGCDVLEISKLTSQKGIPLIIDEAWGSHFPFCKSLPPSSIYRGADLVIHGAHKTLPSITGTSLLHRCSDIIPSSKIKESLSLIETTSPNMMMYLSLEKSIFYMAKMGESILHKAIQKAQKLKDEISFLPFEPFDKVTGFFTDPLKIVLKRKGNITGYQLASWLIDEYKIVPEMADIDTIIFIITGFEEENAIDRLTQALKEILKKDTKEKIKVSPYIPIRDFAPLSITPRQAFYSENKWLPLKNSIGEISASFVIPYPPGIPTLIPGEKITREIVEYHLQVAKSGGILRGTTINNDDIFGKVGKH